MQQGPNLKEQQALIHLPSSLKTKVENVDVDKLKTAPADLSKLSNLVDHDVVKKTVYYKLVTKVK